MYELEYTEPNSETSKSKAQKLAKNLAQFESALRLQRGAVIARAEHLELKKAEELRSRAIASQTEQSRLKRLWGALPVVRSWRRLSRGCHQNLEDVTTIIVGSSTLLFTTLNLFEANPLSAGGIAALGFLISNGLALTANRSASELHGDKPISSEGATVAELMDGVAPEFYGYEKRYLEASKKLEISRGSQPPSRLRLATSLSY